MIQISVFQSLSLLPPRSPHTCSEYILQFSVSFSWESRTVFGGKDVGVASLEGKIMLKTLNIYH